MRCDLYISFLLIVSLTGCFYGQCIDGPCSFERAKMIENIKPYGAHFIKEGVTREERRRDSWSCGADKTVHAADFVVFSAEKKLWSNYLQIKMTMVQMVD